MDPLDNVSAQFGIAPVQLPGIYGLSSNPASAVDFTQARALTGQAVQATSRILDHQDRLMTFRDKQQTFQEREKARADAGAAMGHLQSLDPSSPDYMNQRNRVLSLYPSATLDGTASNFLSLQSSVYEQHQRDRERDQDWKARGALLEQKSQIEQAEDEDDFIATKLPNLTGPAQTKYFESREMGLTHAQGLMVAGRYEDNEKSVLSMLESGFTEDEVAKISDPKTGILDPRKRAAAIGQKKKTAETKTEKKELDIQRKRFLEDQLQDAKDRRRDLDRRADQEDVDPSEYAEIDALEESVRGELGYLQPDRSVPKSAGGRIDPISGDPLPDSTAPGGFLDDLLRDP